MSVLVKMSAAAMLEQLLPMRKSLPSNGEAEGRGSKRQDGKFSLHRNVAKKVD